MSELESLVLGLIWRLGPCTTYQVRRELAQLASSWSSSPGAIYPLIKKLEANALIAAEEEAWGRGRKALYRITPHGKRELKHWIAGVPEWAGSTPADPIRSRAFFLDALPNKAARLDFLGRAEDATHSAIKRIAHEIATRGPDLDGPYGELALTGVTLQLEAKLKWLALIKRRVAVEE